MHRSIEIADAVVTELKAGTFTETGGTFTRTLIPNYMLRSDKDLKVMVVPKSVDITLQSRAKNDNEFAVDIGVFQKVAGDGDALEARALELSTYVGELIDWLTRRTLSDIQGVRWSSIKNDLIFSQEIITEGRTFLSVITVTYKSID